MTGPDALDVLTRRVSTMETEHFLLVERLRRAETTADRNAHALDELEESLYQLAMRNDTDPLAAGTSSPQPPPDPAAPPGATVALAGPPASPGGGDDVAGGAAIQPPSMAVLYGWVEDHIAPLTRKTTTTGEGGGIRWCRRWFEHIDAVERFIALYLAWEELSTEDSATWLSVFLRDHLDPHMATLTSPFGPFYMCNPRAHSDTADPLGTAEHNPAEPPT
ncbi:DUF4913 domain-containing protein [Amycolatopsis tolypomycina]|uniref:DUF4913 domain-containing protein n=1 Tax=Amycolatopsis tolypomycina TaxID=208445 RepID=UPI0033B1314D